jgi:hydroxymethylpyrimidine/phosphomethylpyrimidine kinase
MTTVLSIAGSDSSGNAGIQADIKTFEALGVRCLTAVTAITAQSKTAVFGAYPVASDILSQQLGSVSSETIDAIKIGMILTSSNVHAIKLFLGSRKPLHVVIDTVFSSTSGTPLIEPQAMKPFKEELLPMASLITPNLLEAGALTGMRIWNLGTMKEAARRVFDETGKAVLVKGGHVEGEPVDVLYDGKIWKEFNGKRIVAAGRRGTGCRLSSAIAAFLANGEPLDAAIANAKKFVESYLSGKD